MTPISTQDLPSVASAAIKASMNIGVWAGRKKDRAVEKDVQRRSGAASARAASVHKMLLPDSPALEAITKVAGEARAWFAKVTLPWDDTGWRLVPTAAWFAIEQEVERLRTEFDARVAIFVQLYSQEISKQAFQLGSMFDRTEYPDPGEIAHKFYFRFHHEPVPLAGDFRVDMQNEAVAILAERYERAAQQRVADAMGSIWEQVHKKVQHVHDRMVASLEYNPDAPPSTIEEADEHGVLTVRTVRHRRPPIHQSVIDNALEDCALLRTLNITGDPRLEQVRIDLHSALAGIDIDSLRESPELQESVKVKMTKVLDLFEF